MQTVNIEYKDKDNFNKRLKDIDFPLTSDSILVQVFSGVLSVKYLQKSLHSIKQSIPNAVIIGATSANGEFLEDKTLTNSIVVSISYFEKSTLRLRRMEHKNSYEMGRYLAKELDDKDLKVCILFAEAKYNYGDDFLEGFCSNIDENTYIAGGLAGDNFIDKQTYIIYENQVLSEGAVGVGIYSKELFADIKYTFDWDIIGKEFTIEKTDKNILKQVDGKTPKDLYLTYFGKNLEKNISLISIYFPFIIKRNGYQTSNFLVHIDKSGYFYYNANIFDGEKVSFGITNRDKMQSNLISLHNKTKTLPESVFIFSSGTRRMMFDDKTINETKYFSRLSSSCGLFTYGQFFKKPGQKSVFFQQTLVSLALSENPKSVDVEQIEKEDFTAYEAVFNLINTISKENEHITKNLNTVVQSQLQEIKQKDDVIKQGIEYDSLTKLKNRKSLLIDKDKIKPHAIYLVDIQSFGEINDLYGEKVGDILLQKVSSFLMEYLKDFSTTPYRLHGDTFAILSINRHEKSVYEMIITRFIKALESHDFTFSYNNIRIDLALHVRVGIALMEDCIGRHTIIENADMALKYAKKSKQDFAIYDTSLEIEKSYENELQTIKLIKEALKEDRIIPYYQPIFKKLYTSYEALMRLRLRNGTILTPYQFLDIAKNTRLYFKLTEKMIEKTFQNFANLPNRFSINLSYIDIQNDNTIAYIQKMSDKYDIKEQLTIELLESEIFENYDIVLNFIKIIKKMGIKIAIDDFGSGYSNFSHIIKLNPDILKIDGSLIKHIDTDPKTFAVTKAIISFAKDMNIETVAEFIHSKEVYERAKTLGIDGYQGFYLGKPQCWEDIFS